ncbi:MAG: helix-turn-helix transcriptional regulator [Phycisphaerae bacterium]|jgi:DNA-binding PadR family transcriptional regulator
MHDQALYSGLIRLHILHHACREPVFGLGMIDELGRHGYRLSAGTVYPLLHGLERKGYLRSARVRNGGRYRRVYRATPAGRRALAAAREKVRELFGELFEELTPGCIRGRPGIRRFGPVKAGRTRGIPAPPPTPR